MYFIRLKTVKSSFFELTFDSDVISCHVAPVITTYANIHSYGLSYLFFHKCNSSKSEKKQLNCNMKYFIKSSESHLVLSVVIGLVVLLLYMLLLIKLPIFIVSKFSGCCFMWIMKFGLVLIRYLALFLYIRGYLCLFSFPLIR